MSNEVSSEPIFISMYILHSYMELYEKLTSDEWGLILWLLRGPLGEDPLDMVCTKRR